MESDNRIDLVIPWVDGADPDWQAQKAQYVREGMGDSRPIRYRDWDNLQYLFRGIDKFLPWIHTVHFVTCGQLPPWLNPDAPRLHPVRHSDYIPPQYLPTFSANPIEMNFHRIPGLSEQFIYANDDMFFTRPLRPEFFFRGGLPVDACIATALCFHFHGIFHIVGNDIAVLNEHFSKRAVFRAHPGKWFSLRYGGMNLYNLALLPFPSFSMFRELHLPYGYLKSTFEEVWRAEPELLEATTSHRVRSDEDVNQWLVRYWQLVTGKFAPSRLNRGHFFSIGKDDELIKEAILKQKYPMLCLSDDSLAVDFEAEKQFIKEQFEQILPEKSSFER